MVQQTTQLAVTFWYRYSNRSCTQQSEKGTLKW